MSFLRQIVHSLFQAVKQRLRQWTQPDNHTLALNTTLDLVELIPLDRNPATVRLAERRH